MQEEARAQREDDRKAHLEYMEKLRAEAQLDREIILEQMKTERALMIEQIRLLSNSQKQ
jgi:hypothetical protein